MSTKNNTMQNVWLVTGGAGFIGSNFVRMARAHQWASIINLDKLTYAGNLANLENLQQDKGHVFVHGDIGDRALVQRILHDHRPQAIIHFAAESHVDRSIKDPRDFFDTNVIGTFNLLGEARGYWNSLKDENKKVFRFLNVSTDEVYGSLGVDEAPFHERTPYAPNSPYAASKAASDHFIRAYQHTYGFPTLLTHCSNNYGPYQFPEKLIPVVILNALAGKTLPIYGDGLNVRDWLYVDDHCRALYLVLTKGRVGETYNIGGGYEVPNLKLVQEICAVLDQIKTDRRGLYSRLIQYVKDRPGHDRRYAINHAKIATELGWKPQESFETGIRKTIDWYLENKNWVEIIQNNSYKEWIHSHYENNRSAL